MPSPVGHALGGLACGLLVEGRPVDPPGRARNRPRHLDRAAAIVRLPGPLLRRLVFYGLLGILPDIDFLIGTHSTYTHSLGAVILVGMMAAVAVPPRARWALPAAAAYGSHILLDWLGDDTTPPIGIMALWPITDGFYQSDRHWFMAISRRYWLENFWRHNLTAVMWEIILLAPIALAVSWLRFGANGKKSGAALVPRRE